MSRKTGEIRCFCSRRPLLGLYGIDARTGELYIHIKIYKQSKVYGEIIVAAGSSLRIRCRECLRLHGVKIIQGVPIVQQKKGSPEAEAAIEKYVQEYKGMRLEPGTHLE